MSTNAASMPGSTFWTIPLKIEPTTRSSRSTRYSVSWESSSIAMRVSRLETLTMISTFRAPFVDGDVILRLVRRGAGRLFLPWFTAIWFSKFDWFCGLKLHVMTKVIPRKRSVSLVKPYFRKSLKVYLLGATCTEGEFFAKTQKRETGIAINKSDAFLTTKDAKKPRTQRGNYYLSRLSLCPLFLRVLCGESAFGLHNLVRHSLLRFCVFARND
jgi:hypothetical protein